MWQNAVRLRQLYQAGGAALVQDHLTQEAASSFAVDRNAPTRPSLALLSEVDWTSISTEGMVMLKLPIIKKLPTMRLLGMVEALK